MEIIHVVLGKANPARMNGVNRVVNELATQQAMAGETVCLWGITSSPDHDYPERPYQTRLFPACRNTFKLSAGLLTALDELKPGVVFHLHGGFIPTFYNLSLALHERRIPFVFTPHGSYNTLALEKSRWRKKIYLRLYEKSVLEYALAIHCLGKSEMDGIRRLYPNRKSVLIPYGFEMPPFQPVPIVRHAFVLGFCGRIDIYTKGLDLLLKAFGLLLKECPAVELWIIGDSPERQKLQRMALEMGIDRKVIFYGSRYGKAKLDLLNQMDVFVHPSRNEGLPTAILEAASLGIPCIVTEATNTGDSVRKFNCGEVIRKPDAMELFQSMHRLVHYIGLHGADALKSNARQMIGQGYSWKTILVRFSNLYKRA